MSLSKELEARMTIESCRLHSGAVIAVDPSSFVFDIRHSTSVLPADSPELPHPHDEPLGHRHAESAALPIVRERRPDRTGDGPPGHIRQTGVFLIFNPRLRRAGLARPTDLRKSSHRAVPAGSATARSPRGLRRAGPASFDRPGGGGASMTRRSNPASGSRFIQAARPYPDQVR